MEKYQKHLAIAAVGMAVGFVGAAALKRIDKDKKIKIKADKLSAEMDKAKEKLEKKISEKKFQPNFVE